MSKQSKQKAAEVFAGIISVTRRGVGYVPHEAFEEDIEIAPDLLNTALNGDEVEVRLTGKSGRGKTSRAQGEVVQVLNRAQTSFVGTLIEEDGFMTLHADNPRMYARIRIPEKFVPEGAEVGHKAVVKMISWTNPRSNPLGEITEILGPAGAHETEMRAALASHGFDTYFPDPVIDEANHIQAHRAIDDTEIAKRRDFRSVATFTIDPDDAKDFDDALSFQKLPDGNLEIGVHIADVTHYVRPGSAMDKEARHRATSVYLVDRTIPMLPEALSNDVCSLRPNEDRLTFSAVFTMTPQGEIVNRWFGRTVIHSNKRFTYRAAQDVLDTRQGEYADELLELSRLALILRKEREQRGSIAFDTEEVKFELAEDGTPLRVYRKERLETMKMIEDWMLLANREVAEYISKKSSLPGQGGPNPMNVTFIYRIHDTPDPDRVEELRIFLRAIGHDLGKGRTEQITSRDINKLLKDVKGTPEETLVQMATLRSMAKAVYSHKNVGHFSLGFKHYTHFTSPIRRYPDMMVHRILASHLHGEPISKEELEIYRRAAISSSEREVEAVEAERDSVKFKQVQYMMSKIGQVFDGSITGVTEHGIFVAENESKAEGMVRMSALSDDYYDLDKRRYALVGRKSKKTMRLGDAVKIRLLAADLQNRQLDWELVR